MRDLTVLVDGRVESPVALLEGLAEAGVQVAASCFFPRLGGRTMHLAVDASAVDEVRSLVAEFGGYVADERPCVVLPPDRRFADAHATLVEHELVINVSYHGRRGETVIATSDIVRTRQILGL